MVRYYILVNAYKYYTYLETMMVTGNSIQIELNVKN